MNEGLLSHRRGQLELDTVGILEGKLCAGSAGPFSPCPG
jgi:hypothetical protein